MLRIKSALVALLIGFALPAYSTEPTGLPFRAEIPFEAGVAFDATKVPLREDALSRDKAALEAYAAAALPKALAVSEDAGWIGMFRMRDNVTNPVDTHDARRIALQSCQFTAGLPCRLVAVDNRMAATEQPLLEALPAGQFTDDLLPFWLKSSASTRGKQFVTDYHSLSGEKAFVMAPFAGARIFFNTGASLEEARNRALQRCSNEISQPNVRCVVLAENDRFVIRDIDARRVALTGPKIERVAKVTVLYVGALNCGPCRWWSSTKRQPFLDSPLGKSVEYREVIAATFMDTRNTASWPTDIRWIRDQDHANSGTPRWIILADGKIVRNIRGTGNWDKDAIPYLQDLTKTKRG